MGKDYIEAALMTLTVLAGIFAIFMAVWYLIGDSPTSGELNVGFTVLIASWLIILTFKFGRFEGRSSQFEKNIKDGFERVREDFTRVREDLSEIKRKLK